MSGAPFFICVIGPRIAKAVQPLIKMLPELGNKRQQLELLVG